MIGFIIAILLFNLVAFTTNKRLTKSQIAHVWMFTVAFQICFDLFISAKYWGYWYFSKAIDLKLLLALTVTVPPVNMMFLNWYPFQQRFYKSLLYIFFWTIAIILYEIIAMLPEPWGYFHYGWWSLWHTVLLDPILLVILLSYYKWVIK